MSGGFVSLVGAGPGDPELLTLRAAARLRQADLVLYDALAGREALGLAPQARWFYVGKRARRRSIAQESIERLMIRAAGRGERVVRLKCGDPFVLGRGGEEALALARAGIPYEVVPGVTSAVAAPALAGIPVTHRGLSAGFAVVSGHAESAYAPLLSSLAPGSATVVVLMGLANRASIATLMLASGWPAGTPAAVVLDASHESASAWTGPLARLGACPLPDERPESAGVLVIGEVVSLASAIAAVPIPVTAMAAVPIPVTAIAAMPARAVTPAVAKTVGGGIATGAPVNVTTPAITTVPRERSTAPKAWPGVLPAA